MTIDEGQSPTPAPPNPVVLSSEDRAKELAKFAPSPRIKHRVSWISLFYVIFAVMIGIPVWWQTTSTYRASLPSAEILALTSGADYNIMLSIRIVVLSFDTWMDAELLTTFEQQLFDDLAKSGTDTTPPSGLTVRYFGLARHCVGQELEVFRTSLSLDELEAALVYARAIAANEEAPLMNGGPNSGGGYVMGDTYYFVVLPESTKLLPSTPGITGAGIVRAGSKVSFIRSTGKDIGQLKNTIVRLINKVYVREFELRDTYMTMFASSTTDKSASSLVSAKERLRQFKTSGAYDITFTLVNPQPEHLNASWELTDGFRLFLDPFVSRLSRYISLAVSSQYIYAVDLEKEARRAHLMQVPEADTDASSTPSEKSSSSTKPASTAQPYYYYKELDLPHLINPLESYLATQVSGNPSLNMVVYLPSVERSPMYLHNFDNKISPFNAFLSPQWGGLLVYNYNKSLVHKSNKVSIKVDVRQLMSVFVPQLKTLLGLKRRVPRIILPLENPDISGVTVWEQDSWLRRRTLENIATAGSTLASLVDLLDKVSNMVIKDEVAEHIYHAVNSLVQSRANLADGALTRAFLTSKQALLSAEKAFFDPSLLGLLYFPDDQKYGVYMPLFLPLLLPILITTFQAVKYLRGIHRQGQSIMP